MRDSRQVLPGLGSGIYTYHEAARLLQAHTNQVRRWAQGYVYVLNGEAHEKAAVLQREKAGEGLLTFFDLIELLFVRELRKAGVKMQIIRDAARLLSGEFDTPYPFAYEPLYTDGRQILQQAGGQYANVVSKQQVFRFVEELFKNIDFINHLARVWYPLGRDRLIVVDPHRSFGAPIDVRTGVRTDVIYMTYKAEQDVEAVADWYEVDEPTIRAAIELEERWQKAA